jgi:Tfp pilus assembly protein PilX
MASNTQLSARALAAAERALSSAEAAVDGMDGYNFSTTGYYDIESGANEPMNPQDMDWDDSDSVEATIDDDGRYIVEYISWEPLDGASLALGGGGAIKPPGDFVDVYRVTARAEDAKGAVRMVQSIFVKRF